MNEMRVELRSNDVDDLRASLREAAIAWNEFATEGVTGLDVIHVVIEISQRSGPPLAAILSAMIMKGVNMVIIQDGKRTEVTSEESVEEAILAATNAHRHAWLLPP